MLRNIVGLCLFVLFSSFSFTSAFADSFVVEIDKQQYFTGDSLLISGQILELGMPIIAMSVYDPNGKILSANNLEISPENTFSKTLFLDSTFYEQSGEYQIKFDYGQISEEYFFSINDSYESKNIDETSFPEIILLETEKNHYFDGDTILISGNVSSLDSPSVLIGVYDPFGMPTGFYFGDINSDLEFSTSFLVKDGVNFKLDGTYSIKAHYADSEVISFFDYSALAPIVSQDEIIQEETIVEQTIQETALEIIQEEPIVEQTIQETALEIIQEEPIVEQTIQEQNNLSVEDIELGKLLNQINLECDSSTYTDIISYYDGMGPALYRLCKFDSSLNFFNESLIQNPSNIEVLVNKGSAISKLGKFSESIIYYDLALDENPNFIPAKNNKANALANMGYFDNAISLYREILEVNPDSTTIQKNLQTALSSRSDFSIDSQPLESDKTHESNIKKITDFESEDTEKNNFVNNEKEKSENFFDELKTVFSSLSSMFEFLN